MVVLQEEGSEQQESYLFACPIVDKQRLETRGCSARGGAKQLLIFFQKAKLRNIRDQTQHLKVEDKSLKPKNL